MSGRKVHQYFERRPSEWSVLGFLEECDQEPFQAKVALYLTSLEILSQTEGGQRQKQAERLIKQYKQAGLLFFFFFVLFLKWWRGVGSLSFPPFKSLSRATKLVVGRQQSLSLSGVQVSKSTFH